MVITNIFISIFPFWLLLSPLSLISTAVWHMTHAVQQNEVPTSPMVSPSMLYLSLASCLRRRVGMHGMMQPSKQYNNPLLPMSSAVLYVRQGVQQRPQQQTLMSPQQLHIPCFHSPAILEFQFISCRSESSNYKL